MARRSKNLLQAQMILWDRKAQLRFVESVEKVVGLVGELKILLETMKREREAAAMETATRRSAAAKRANQTRRNQHAQNGNEKHDQVELSAEELPPWYRDDPAPSERTVGNEL